jgi:ketosteroid isomerase-like protein
MKLGIKLFVSTMVLMLVTGCGAQKVDLEKEKAALLQTDIEFSQASVEKGAPEAFRMYLAEDAIQLPTRANPVVGRDSIYASMSKSSGDFTLSWLPQAVDVAGAGDMGWTWGWFTTTWTDENGEQKQSQGKYLNVWRKMPDGTWKVVVDMGN